MERWTIYSCAYTHVELKLIQTNVCLILAFTWGCPYIMVPLVIIHFRWGFSLINHPDIGVCTPMAMEPPTWMHLGSTCAQNTNSEADHPAGFPAVRDGDLTTKQRTEVGKAQVHCSKRKSVDMCIMFMKLYHWFLMVLAWQCLIHLDFI